MPTYVGDPPVAGTIPGETNTPPDSAPTPPTDTATTHELSGITTIAALQAAIDAIPDGATIGFEAEAVIEGDADDKLHLDGRNGLTLVARAAKLSRTERGDTQIFVADGGFTGLRVFDLIVQGVNPDPGKWDEDYENEHAFFVGGGINVEFSGCSAVNVGGDGLYMTGGNNQWSRNVRFHHGSFSGIGRMGAVITDGARDVVVDFNTWTLIGYHLWLVEPNNATVGGILAGAINWRISDNTVGTKPYGDYPDDPTQALGYALALTGASGGGIARQVSMLRNMFSDGAMRVGAFNNDIAVSDLVIESNTAEDTFTPSGDISHVVTFSGVSNGSIRFNTQPCSAPSAFETHSGSSGITVEGNVTT